MAPDVWLALIGQEHRCLLPQGAFEYDQVYGIVSKYEGFDFEKVIASMSSVENKEFLLWTKK